ncbi:MAG: hypothetical protein Q8O64_05885 [Sideroxyarcus sp.]|nr:hypothetical protein [Sideroxyarcus sp.]
MSHNQMIESAEKATQTAALLIQDMQEMVRFGTQMEALLVLPEIERVARVRNRLSALSSALQSQAAPEAPSPR